MIACEIFSMIMGMGIFLDPGFEPLLHTVIVDCLVNTFFGQNRAVHLDRGQPIQRLSDCLVR